LGQSRAAVSAYQKGIREYLQPGGSPDKAEKFFLRAVKLDPIYPAAWLALGELYEERGDSMQCFKAFRAAVQTGAARAGYFNLGRAALGFGGYATSLAAWEDYLELERLPDAQVADAQRMQANAAFGLQARQHPFPGIVPRSIKNTQTSHGYPESYFFPSISGDQSTLYFTGRNYHQMPRDENIFATFATDTLGWSAPHKVQGWINTLRNEGAVSVQGDERRMVFAGCEREDGFGSCDIYLSELTPFGWTQGKNMGAAINTPQWETQPCLSADGQYLFFVRDSKKMGSHSNIWMSRWNGESWSKAEMLPSTINGTGNEFSPFLHADGKTLYFASTSHVGMGGMDLYKSEWQADGSWSSPENLGFPINDHLDNFGLVVAPDGRSGFLSGGLLGESVWEEEVSTYGSDIAPNSYNLPVIFEFELPEAVAATPIVWLEVYAVDIESLKPIPTAKWSISRQGLEQEVTHLGFLLETSLPLSTEMAFSVQAPGYNFESYRLLTEERAGNVQTDTVYLRKTQVGDAFRLNNLLFAFDEAVLLPASMLEIHRVAKWLEENPALQIQIEGHTDNQGSAAYNQVLSEKRASAVMEALTLQGISKERMQAKGFGASQPVASNTTEEGQALNRRTEIKILSTSGR
jgi:outer membrane protein OmpA-like peptidoglycan-associated protein